MLALRSQLEQSWRTRRGQLARCFETSRSAEAGTRATAPGPHRQLLQELFQELLRDIEEGGFNRYPDTAIVRQRVRKVIDRALEQGAIPPFARGAREELENELVAEAAGLGPLSSLVADATVSDILVNGPSDVFIDRFGRLEKTSIKFDSAEHLLQLISRLVAAQGRHIDAGAPYVDVRMHDGSRLHAVVPPLAPAPVLCIRRSRAIPFTLDQLCAAGTLTRDMADFLIRAIRSGVNIVISGGVGSGKTTLLNVLAGFVPLDARIVTIEETAELRLPHAHVVSLEARPANNEGRGEVTVRTLVRNALRMRADRLIVGEVRGAEVFDMLQAMNTGHAGSLTTVHANSSRDALRRLESLVLLAGFPLPSSAIRELLSMTIHVVVQLKRFDDGVRRIVEIGEMSGDGQSMSMNRLFVFDGGRHAATALTSRMVSAS